MDQEIWKLALSQGIGFVVMALAVKWLLKDRDKGWEVASNEQAKRIELLEATSLNRTQELKELRTEFAEYRRNTQIDFNTIHAANTDRLMTVTTEYNKQLSGLQTEIRALYQAMLNQKICPVDDKFKIITSDTGTPGT